MQYFLYSIVIFRLFSIVIFRVFLHLTQNFVLEIEETNVKQTNERSIYTLLYLWLKLNVSCPVATRM